MVTATHTTASSMKDLVTESPQPEVELIRVLQGDARSTGLPDRSVHAVVTSPPYYGLRDYGDHPNEIGAEFTPEAFVESLRAVGREMWRVLRDDGTWWLNLGDSYARNPKKGGSGPGGKESAYVNVADKNLLMIPQLVALALRSDGWVVRAQVPWVKAVCMPESVRDRPTVAHEYVFLLAKSSQYFWDADAVRMSCSDNSHGSPSVNPGSKDRATKANAGSLGKWSAADAANGRNIRTSDFFAAGFDAYEADLQEQLAHVRSVKAGQGLMLSADNDPLVFLVNPKPSSLAHFAMWPPRLVAPMIKASTSEKGCCSKCGAQWQRIVEKVGTVQDRWSSTNGYAELGGTHRERTARDIKRTVGFSPSCECNAGDPIPCTVLDPFAGSGTTLQVCRALGRRSIGIELMEENLGIITERLKTYLNPRDWSGRTPEQEDYPSILDILGAYS